MELAEVLAMSKHVHEIMNREVLMLEADEPADDALGWMGVLVLVESVVGEPDEFALVEAPASVRARLHELLSVPQSDRPDITRLLEHPARLRFRAAAIEDARRGRPHAPQPHDARAPRSGPSLTVGARRA
ncbi:hypothetical protein WMF18_29260 [Sorangium sp. So ce315]|uniref:hypothetical protein n=1 Tax=Sorangium sp. So ce315 TaxID=3133299 RepID=UPI003F5DEB0E